MSFFHYVTYKYIIIKDKRLGIAYYGLAALIILYTIVQIFINKAYLQFDLSPQGNIRLIVTTPPTEKKDSLNYCCPQPENIFCESCRALDGLSLRWPVESRALTIATFIKERWEKQDCNNSYTYDQSKRHTSYEVERETNYFATSPEDALIKIEHSISATGNYFAASHRMMNGLLLGKDGSIIKRMNSKVNSSVDKIWLKQFLMAANISLDESSSALNANGRTYRQNGIVLQVSLDYRNADETWFGTTTTNYVYRIHHVAYSDYRVRQEIPIPNNAGSICERIVNKRYGVRLEFSQIGKIGHFSFSNLLFQLVSLVSLLTLTATVIDIITLYVAPDKDIYRQHIFDSSPELREQSQVISKTKNE